jgi:hypothetical protein
MFNVFRRPATRNPTIREALVQAGPLSAAEITALTIVERHGSYSGRHVNFFRAFDPSTAAARAIEVKAFKDLDAHEQLVLESGHVEQGGRVVVNSRPEREDAAPRREPADRAAHTDDERFVFRTTASRP